MIETFTFNDIKKLKDYWDELSKIKNMCGYIQISGAPIANEHIWHHTKIATYDNLFTNKNFLIESKLFDSDSQKSYHIFQSNDLHRAVTVDLQDVKKENIIEYSYLFDTSKYKLSETNSSIYKIILKQIWQPKKDEFCNDYEVLEPIITIFSGFKESK